MAKYSIVAGIKIATEFVPETFGRLTTIGPKFLLPVGTQGKRAAYQVCQCTCGSVKVVNWSDMQAKKTESCGCIHREMLVSRLTTHGESKKGRRTAEYVAYHSMIYRCKAIEGHPDYADYAGRGIRVCDRWLDPVNGYANFLADMGRKPSSKHSIERDCVNGNYEPGNCRWATVKEQARNRRNNRHITACGQTKLIVEWAEILGVDFFRLYRSLKKNPNYIQETLERNRNE